MIKTIIFDLGGVIVTINQEEAIRRFRALGISNIEDYLDCYTQGGIFGQLEEGLISAEDFRREISKLCGREVSFDECKHAWLGYRADVPERNLEALRHLRAQGYRVCLLSNTNPYMMSWAESPEFDGHGHSINDYFDALYKSYELGVMKPSELFFQKVLLAEKVLPSECIFIDDGTRNVAAASELGIPTILAENGKDWTETLFAQLTKINLS